MVNLVADCLGLISDLRVPSWIHETFRSGLAGLGEYQWNRNIFG